MDSYKQMYTRIFNCITDVITELQKIQQEAEEIFVEEGTLQHFTTTSADKPSN